MLVKIFLVFIGFLLFGWISAEKPHEQRTFAKLLNQERREAAKKLYIPNMHELVYDWNLAQVTGSKDWSIENKEDRFMTMKEYQKASARFNNMSYLDIMESVGIQGITRDWEYLSPLQTKIGCATTSKNPEKINQTLCAFGDRKDLNDLKNADGKPGSRCMPGYKNDDGLCSVDKVLAQEKFITELNQLRREFAVEINIADMHELIIQDRLVEMAENFNWNGTLPSPGDNWRYMWFFDYQNGAILVKLGNQHFMNQSEEKRNSQRTRQEKTFVRTSEHLNPLQTYIGCAEKESGFWNFSVICFLGPSSVFPFANGIPGSKCDKGYVNTNGLCTLVPTPKTVPETKTPSPMAQTTVAPAQTDPATTKVPTVAPAAPSTTTVPTDSQQNTIHIPYNSETSAAPVNVAPPTDFSTFGNPDNLANVSTEPDLMDETTTTPISLQKSVNQIKEPHLKNQLSQDQSMEAKPTPFQPSKTDLLIAEYLRNEQDGDAPDEDDYHADIDSSGSNVVWVITMVFVMITVL